MRSALDAGGLSTEAVTQALHAAAIQEGGRYWMLDPEAGLWHAHDGRAWTRLDPPLIALADRTRATRSIGGSPPPLTAETPPARSAGPRSGNTSRTRKTEKPAKAESSGKPARPRKPSPARRKPAATERTTAVSTALTAALLAELEALLRAGKKVSAVKAYRDATGVGLKEAKDAVDALEAATKASPGESPTVVTPRPPRATGRDTPPAGPTTSRRGPAPDEAVVTSTSLTRPVPGSPAALLTCPACRRAVRLYDRACPGCSADLAPRCANKHQTAPADLACPACTRPLALLPPLAQAGPAQQGGSGPLPPPTSGAWRPGAPGLPNASVLVYLFGELFVPPLPPSGLRGVWRLFEDPYARTRVRAPVSQVQMEVWSLMPILLATAFWSLREQGLVGLRPTLRRRDDETDLTVEATLLRTSMLPGLEGAMLQMVMQQTTGGTVYDAIHAWYGIDVTRPHVPIVGTVMREAVERGLGTVKGSLNPFALVERFVDQLVQEERFVEIDFAPRRDQIMPFHGAALDLLGRWLELPTRDPALFRALLFSCGSAALSRYDNTVSPS